MHIHPRGPELVHLYLIIKLMYSNERREREPKDRMGDARVHHQQECTRFWNFEKLHCKLACLVCCGLDLCASFES